MGGTVRDLLLERESRDLDLLVFGDVFRVARELASALEGSWFVLDDFQKHIRVQAKSLPGLCIDLSESKGQSLGENLKERDFTINAMALDILEYQTYLETGDLYRTSEKIVDPGQGRSDTRARLIRLNHPQAFANDPIRLLRAPRLAAQLGFDIARSTVESIRSKAPLLAQTSGERVRDELFQILKLIDSAKVINKLKELGLLAHFLPELTSTVGVTQNEHHALDVWGHSLAALNRLEAKQWQLLDIDQEMQQYLKEYLKEPLVEGRSRWLILKLAALLHDIGKPQVWDVKQDGKVTFHRHEKVGSLMASAIANRLRLSRREEKSLSLIVYQHLRPLHLFLAENHTEKAEYRLFKQLEPETISVLLLSLADRSAGKSAKEIEGVRWFFKFIEQLIIKYFRDFKAAIGRRLLSGEDLINTFGLSPGPQFRSILSMIEEAQMEGRIHTREEAINLVNHIFQASRTEHKKKRS
ncbi:MAG: HD domain-containing protein [Syntrophomonadaceae bacterium]|nr:HD domain-containing protein [Syntrophomonadaceae bacterium]